METTGASALSAADPITQALACHDAAYSNRFKVTPDRHLRLGRPKFKPLVLSIVPNATVRRVGGTYECFIGEKHISWHGMGGHCAPDRAWVDFARYVQSPEFASAQAAGVFA